MTKEQKEQVTEEINNWIEQSTERSAATLSAKSNVSEAHISKIRKGEHQMQTGRDAKGDPKYSPIGDDVFRKLAHAVGLKFHKSIHWDTPNYTLIQKVCQNAQKSQKRVLIDGDTGLGKTYALERYALEHDRVMYIKVTQSMTRKDLLTEICLKLQIHDDLRALRRKLNAIRDKVTARPDWLIIMDEMEYCPYSLFHVAKEIADFTQGKCGMIMAGMGLEQMIIDMSNKKRKGFPQIKRRFFPNRVKLRDITKEGIKDICKANGITDSTAVNVLSRYCFDYDALQQMILFADTYQEKKAEPVTGQILIEAFNLEW